MFVLPFGSGMVSARGRMGLSESPNDLGLFVWSEIVVVMRIVGAK